MRRNLEEMVRLVKQARAEPVLVGMMIPPNYGIDYAAQFHGMYASLAKKTGAALVPFLLAGIADQPELFQADQLHPIAQAQPVPVRRTCESFAFRSSKRQKAAGP